MSLYRTKYDTAALKMQQSLMVGRKNNQTKKDGLNPKKVQLRGNRHQANAITIELFESIRNHHYSNRISIQIPTNTTRYLNRKKF